MKKIILPLVVCFWMTSCAPRYFYSPSAQNIPVLVKAGDSKLAANYSNNLSGGVTFNDRYTGTSRASKAYGYDLEAAVAVTNNFALQASHFYRTEQNGDNNAIIDYKRKLTEVGLGYFKPFQRKHKTVILQAFGGVGFGKFRLNDSGIDYNNAPYTRYHYDDIFKIYIQPAVIFKIRENFNMSVASRLSIINYKNIQTNYTSDELSNYGMNGPGVVTYTFWEPSFTQSFGIKSVPSLLFEYQLGLSLVLNTDPIDYHPINFAIGICLDIPKLIKGSSASAEN